MILIIVNSTGLLGIRKPTKTFTVNEYFTVKSILKCDAKKVGMINAYNFIAH